MTMLDEEARLDVPRHDLIRGVTPLRAEDDGNVMIGYPIVFNQWTEINSWEGRFLERVLPSGPAKSMKENRQRVQYNHGMHPVVGSSGLGTPKVMKRDNYGVYTETPLSDTSYNRDIIRPLLADKVLDGMSFRFSVIEDKWKKPEEPTDWNPLMLPERSLVEFKWMEFGPVDWPAYEAATAGIRSQAALALWLQAPDAKRREVMRQFDILPTEPRVFTVDWEAPKTTVPDEEREEPKVETEDRSDPTPPADPKVTGTPDEPPVRHSSQENRKPVPPSRGQRLANVRRAHELAAIQDTLAKEKARTDEYLRRYERLAQGA